MPGHCLRSAVRLGAMTWLAMVGGAEMRTVPRRPVSYTHLRAHETTASIAYAVFLAGHALSLIHI